MNTFYNLVEGRLYFYLIQVSTYYKVYFIFNLKTYGNFKVGSIVPIFKRRPNVRFTGIAFRKNKM
jgi:hypothetical protein